MTEDEVAGLLKDSERLLWTGRPATGILLRESDRLGIPASFIVPFIGIGWFFASPGPSVPRILYYGMGVLILLWGAYCVIGRFYHDAWKRERTVYALTDRRILVVQGQKVTAFDRKALPPARFDLLMDGRAIISFRPPVLSENDPMASAPEFVGIPEAQRVFQLARGKQPAS